MREPKVRQNKENSKKEVIFDMEKRRKKKEKLEGKAWLREDMIETRIFSKEFIERYLISGPFMKLYYCWESFLYAKDVRDPKAWLLDSLDRYEKEGE